jgi:hypothetical protein
LGAFDIVDTVATGKVEAPNKQLLHGGEQALSEQVVDATNITIGSLLGLFHDSLLDKTGLDKHLGSLLYD